MEFSAVVLRGTSSSLPFCIVDGEFLHGETFWAIKPLSDTIFGIQTVKSQHGFLSLRNHHRSRGKISFRMCCCALLSAVHCSWYGLSVEVLPMALFQIKRHVWWDCLFSSGTDGFEQIWCSSHHVSALTVFIKQLPAKLYSSGDLWNLCVCVYVCLCCSDQYFQLPWCGSLSRLYYKTIWHVIIYRRVRYCGKVVAFYS